MPKLIRITTAPISLHVLLKDQMKYMQSNGFDVLMVSSDGKELKQVLKDEGCRHHIIPMTRDMSPFKDLRCLWLLYKLFRQEKPDIVHSHTPKAGLLAMLASKFSGVKIRIHTVAGLRFITTKGFYRRILVFMEKLTGKSATHVWPNSFSLFEYIKINKLVRQEKLELIGKGSTNGINLSKFSISSLDQERLEAVKKKIDFDDRLSYFLSVGRIVHDKGIDEMVMAFAGLYEENNLIRLIVVGAFEDKVDPVSDETKKKLKTHPGIILTGWSEDVEYYMSFAFALLHASHREGFPNVLLQAGAMLCPVICSRIPGNIDIISHQKTGLVFGKGDVLQLFQQMKFALANKAIIKNYSATLIRQIREDFDQPVIHQLIKQRYIQLLAAQ
jgi:glycosyltransferase involved in cell wall biosynthesis